MTVHNVAFTDCENVVVPDRTWTLVATADPGPGYCHVFAYLRIGDHSDDGSQYITRFVRDPEGVADHTASQDHLFTPGKEYVSRAWALNPSNIPVIGVEIWQNTGGDVVVEYAQLKAAR